MAPEHGRMNASPGCAPFTLARSAACRRIPRGQHTLGTLAMLAMLCASVALPAVRAHADSAAEPASSEPPGKAASAIADSAVSPPAGGAAAPATADAATAPATTPAAAPPAAEAAPPPPSPAPAPVSSRPAPGLDDAPAAAPAAHASPAAGTAPAPSGTRPVPPGRVLTFTAAQPASVAPVIPHGPGSMDGSAALPATSQGAGTELASPTNFDDVGAWLEYRSHNHIGSLPQEARILYRRGLQFNNTGSFEEAVRMVRGACELDAEYVAPHLTLASWFLVRDPSQALLQIAASIEIARQNFLLQLAFMANAVVVLIQSLFLALLAAALMIVFLHNAQLRHMIQERLGLFVELRGARIWAMGLLVLPFLCGLGLALPALVMLGLLWPVLRMRQRAVFILLGVMIAAMPWFEQSIDRLSMPLRSEQAPFFGIPELASEPYSADRQQQMTQLADTHADNAFAHFALGWLARRGGDLQLAERAYRRALQLWPHDDRVLNNLGNALAMQGRSDEALVMYQRAYTDDPHNAAAYFNASQIFTQRFEYKAANEALQRASALNFDLVKAYQAQATEDGLLPLVDQWLAPRTFWAAMPTVRSSPLGAALLPPGWRSKWETSGWLFGLLVVLLSIGAVVLGRRMHNDMPLRACSNCGRVVCRRCAERRREVALCATCAAVELQAESMEFARVLLMQRRRGVAQSWEMLRTALATLIPGFGMLSLDRLFLPIVLMAITADLCAPWIGLSAPFTFEPRLLDGARSTAMWFGIGMWLVVYAFSLIGYFVARKNYREPVEATEVEARPRSGSAPRRDTAAAA